MARRKRPPLDDHAPDVDHLVSVARYAARVARDYLAQGDPDGPGFCLADSLAFLRRTIAAADHHCPGRPCPAPAAIDAMLAEQIELPGGQALADALGPGR